MPSLGSLIEKARAKYDKWERESKEREKRRLDQVQTKRAREALRHVYQMERARRRVDLAQQIAAAKEAELEARRTKSELRELRIKDIKAVASLFGLGRGKKTKASGRRRKR